MSLRFQADADFNNSAVLALTRQWPHIEIRSAIGHIPDALSDLEILNIAAEQDRVLLTHDVSTMPRHFNRFTQTRDSPGVILVPQDRSIYSIVEAVFLVWSEWTADDLRNKMRWLPHLVVRDLDP